MGARGETGRPPRYSARFDKVPEDTPVSCFVACLEGELGLQPGRSSTRRLHGLIGSLARWAVAEGIPLDVEHVFDPEVIERFCEEALANFRSRATYRSLLRNAARTLTDDAGWAPLPAPMAWRSVVPPYTNEEVTLLTKDAAGQPTKSRRHAARALLVLGLGAGLDGRWVARVTAADVCRHDGGVTVRVENPQARVVVVLAEWEDDVWELAESAHDEFLVGGKSDSKNRTSSLTEKLFVPTGHPRLVPARLRSTWLVSHLDAGIRLPELCLAAGIKGATVFTDLLEYLQPLEPDQAAAALRRAPV